MNKKEYDRLLLSYGIGKKFLSSGNVLFDRLFGIVSIKDLRTANEWSMSQLGWYQYKPESSDCDTFHFIKVARDLEWFLKNRPRAESYGIGPTWGYYNGNGHMWQFATTDHGLVHLNYGVEETPDTWKSYGSIGV